MTHGFRNLPATKHASLGRLYKKIREDAGYTQEQLAKIFGVRATTISACELKGQLSVDMLNRYADHFKVSTDFLLGRTSIRTPHQTARAICKSLGIKEEAVVILLNAQKKKKRQQAENEKGTSQLSSGSENIYSEFLSSLITDKNFANLCNSFRNGVIILGQTVKSDELTDGINSRMIYSSYLYECMQHFMAFLRLNGEMAKQRGEST